MNKHNLNPSRRHFLALSMAGAAAALNASKAVLAASPADIRFGFTSYTWGNDWDLPTMLTNCEKAQAFGLELRTDMNFAHKVELNLTAEQRSELKKRFADSPVKLVGLACGERFDSPDPEKVGAALEKAKAYVKLTRDLGGSGLRVFPNDFHKDVPKEKTLAQIAEALRDLSKFAEGFGVMIRLEAHGSAGELPNMKTILEQVDRKNVRLKLNSAARDTEGAGFEQNFRLVQPYLGDTIHIHELDAPDFPYQLQTDLLVNMGWSGWCLLEATRKEPDRVQALLEQRLLFDRMLARAKDRHAS